MKTIVNIHVGLVCDTIIVAPRPLVKDLVRIHGAEGVS